MIVKFDIYKIKCFSVRFFTEWITKYLNYMFSEVLL